MVVTPQSGDAPGLLARTTPAKSRALGVGVPTLCQPNRDADHPVRQGAPE